jgi:ABC-type phosphate transport system substrate-binding protein
VRIIPLRLRADSEAFLPEPALVANGQYPLARTLYLVAMEPVATRIQTLVDYCTGPESRPLIESAGFVPVSGEAAP